MGERTLLKSIEHFSWTVELHYDDHYGDPRDQLGFMGTIFLGGRYCQHLSDPDTSREEALWAVEHPKEFISCPVYYYSHGNLLLQTTPFGDPWDSGLAGFTYIEKRDARKWMEWKRITPGRVKHIQEMLSAEIDILNSWINGEIYGYFVIDDKDNHLDSCWGFFSEEQAINEGKEFIDSARRVITIRCPGR